MFKTKGIYASGMVLQRNTMNCIYGEGDFGKTVEFKFKDIILQTKVDNQNEWHIEFNPGQEGGPYKLELNSDSESIVFDDVYVGEVWLASGQSNAQLPMERLFFSYKDEFDLPENPDIRIITIPIAYSFNVEKDTIENPQWMSASKDTLSKISGTTYFFAKKLQHELKIPIGVINASQGGSPISAWMNYDSFRDLGKKDFIERINKWRRPGEIDAARDFVQIEQKKWDTEILVHDIGSEKNWENSHIDSSWKECEIPGDISVMNDNPGVLWLKKEFVLSKEQASSFNSQKTWLWMGTIVDADKAWINGNFCGVTYYTYPPRRYVVPAGVLKEGVNTITLRIQKNSRGPIRFYEEKPYCLFTENCNVHPVVYRNQEVPENLCNSKGTKIELQGSWYYGIGCKLMTPRPEELFFEWEPSALFNGMLAPVFKYAIAGAFWYQGESNATQYEYYESLLSKMICLWREKFIYAANNMPFIAIQLPNWADGYRDESKQNFGNWPELRSAQKRAIESNENCGIVNLIDAGEWNDLHPEKKKTAGTRTAIEALRIAYKKEYNSCPICEYCKKEGNSFIIHFDTGTAKLNAFGINKESVDFGCSSNDIFGFEILTKDNRVISIQGRLISDKDVEISVPDNIDDVVELRYLWKNNPWIVNLYSDEGLPAMAFKIKL